MKKLAVVLLTAVMLVLGSAVMAEAWELRDIKSCVVEKYHQIFGDTKKAPERVKAKKSTPVILKAIPLPTDQKSIEPKIQQTKPVVKTVKKAQPAVKHKKKPVMNKTIKLTKEQRDRKRWRAEGFFTWSVYGGSPLIRSFDYKNPVHIAMLKAYFDELSEYQTISAIEADELKTQLQLISETKKPEWTTIEYGDQFILLTFKKSGKMVVKHKAIAAGAKGRMLAAIRLHANADGRELEVKIPLICGNITITPPKPITPAPPAETKPEPEPPAVTKPEEPGTPETKPEPEPPAVTKPEEPGLPPASEPEAEKKCEGCGGDLYIGAGNYMEAHPEQDAKGWYSWMKARYRPVGFHVVKDHIDMCVGGFFYGAYGEGYSEDYKYRWYEYSLGPSAKIIDRKHHWDADIDAGLLGQLYSEGHVSRFESFQVDKTLTLGLHVNYYARRAEGHKWFPRIEWNLDTRFVYDTNVEQTWDGQKLVPKDTDNRRLETNFDIGIYDININDAVRITPGFNIGFGRAYSVGDNFIQVGPNVRFSLYDKDILHLNIFNYKEMFNGDGDQWHPISGWIAPSEMYAAYLAYKTNPATADDINTRRQDKDSPVSDAILKIKPDK